MIFRETWNGAVPKLALKSIEVAQAIGLSPAALDRLTLRVVLRPCRATRRRLSVVKEINAPSRQQPLVPITQDEISRRQSAALAGAVRRGACGRLYVHSLRSQIGRAHV